MTITQILNRIDNAKRADFHKTMVNVKDTPYHMIESWMSTLIYLGYKTMLVNNARLFIRW